MAMALIELHSNPDMFTAFIGWVDQMKAQLPAMSGAARHGCCSSIALAIGLLLHDIDMIIGFQDGLGPNGMVPEYIITTALPTNISLNYLLPKCDSITDVLQKIQRASNGGATSMSGLRLPNPAPRQSTIRSTQSPPCTNSVGVTSCPVMRTSSSIALAEKTLGSQVVNDVAVDTQG